MKAYVLGMVLMTGVGLLPVMTHASTIETADIVAMPQHVTGSGNGTLDLRLFTYSGSEILNEDKAKTFNGDNGNKVLPQGNGDADINSFAQSYITTAGKLKAYYALNFPKKIVNEIMLCLDLNETGNGEPVNTLERLDIILNPTGVRGNPDPFGDVSSDAQAAIGQVYGRGTLIAHLAPEPANNLPVNNQGAGFADYAIFTGINPFTLNDSDVLLFNVSMSRLNNGAEEIFLSGSYSPTDVVPAPEPAVLVLLAFGGLTLLHRRQS